MPLYFDKHSQIFDEVDTDNARLLELKNEELRLKKKMRVNAITLIKEILHQT